MHALIAVLRLLCALPLAVAGLALMAESAIAAFPGANGKIVFRSSESPGLWTVDAQGSRVPVGSGAEPAWSPDGRKIAFRGSTGLYVKNADGSGSELVIGSSGPRVDAAWSPDGLKLAYVQGGSCALGPCFPEIYVVNADGTGNMKIADASICAYEESGAPLRVRSLAPAWSPDGSSIAYARACDIDGSYDNDYSEPADLWTMNPDGSDKRLVFDGIGDGGSEEYRGISVDRPSWSPDGAWIALGSRPGVCDQEYPPASNCEQGIWVVDSTGGNLTRLTSGQDLAPAWSPDGSRIVFERSDFYTSLWTMNADGTNQQQLSPASPGAFYEDPDWQPVGAFDPYPRPGYGTPIQVPLVTTYARCTTPDSVHVAPLQLDSCSLPVEESSILTTSNIGKGAGYVRLRVVRGNPSTPADEADILIDAIATDVRCARESGGCPDGAGSDFDGKVLLQIRVRVTDRASGFGAVSATTSEGSLNVPVQCTATANASLGSRCEVHTTADTLIPGWAREEKRTILSISSVELRDPGLNGTGYGSSCPPTCGNGDEAAFMREGLLAP